MNQRETITFARAKALMETMRDSKTGTVADGVAGATGFTAVIQHPDGKIQRHRIAMVLLVDRETPTEMLSEMPSHVLHTLMAAWNDMMIGVFGPELMARLMVEMIAEAHDIPDDDGDELPTIH